MVQPAQTAVLIFSMAFAAPSGSAAANEVLTNVAAIMSLTHEQATQSIRISITGVVTLAEPTWGGLFFVQDSTGGVFVNNTNTRPAVGDVVQVTGVSHPGGFATDIYSPKWNKLGTASLPEPKQVSVERLMSGAEDGNRVEVSGVVRFARKEGELLLLELAAGGYRFRAHPRASTNLVANSLIGATVRVRGTAAASFNRELRQIIGVNLYMPHESDLIIEHLPITPISELPLGSLRSILQYHRNDSDELRIRVRGVATYQRPGEDIFLQDETDGLQVRCRHTNSFAPGEIVEAVGFPVMERNLPVLQDAILIRTKEPAGRIVSRDASIQELRLVLHHGDMITLKGTLLDRSLRPLRVASPGSNAPVENILTLQCSNYLVSVTAPASKKFAGLAGIPIGSTLEVSGLCLLQVKGTPNTVQGVNLEAVHLLLPDIASIRILKRPSWWTPQRLLTGLGILLAMSTVGAIWSLMILRKNSALKASIAEQEELTQELRRREAYLAEAQRLSHTGSFGCNLSKGELSWSEETYRIYGCDPQVKPTIQMLLDRIHPDDVSHVQQSMARAAEGKACDSEHRLLMPDGSVKGVHVVAHSFREESGLFVGAIMDITERKRAEETLRQSEAYLAEAQRLSQTGSWAWSPNPDKDIRYWSEECYRVLGFDPSEPLPRFEQFFQRIHLDDQAGTRERFEKAIHDKADFELDYRIVHPDKGVRDIHVVGHAVLYPSGDLCEFVGTVIDITERKRAEEAIRRSEAFLAEGQRLTHTGSWGWNASTGKVTWSQEHFRTLGLDPQHTNPSLDVFWERVHPDDRIGVRRTFESAIREKRDFEQEFRIVTPDWSIRHLHGVGHAVLNKANELVEFIGSTMDITERKRAEERAQSQREAIRLALNSFVEKLDVNRFVGDIIAELNKQFHAKSWELWLYDEAISALLLHSSSHPTERFSPEFGSRNARPLEELQDVWPIKDAARAPQILELSSQESLLCRRHGESLTRQGIKTLMIVPLVLGEENLGFLELHFQSQTQFSSDDLELAQAHVNRATLALQLNRLTRRAEELAVTEERYRLAREIHDTLAQAFAGVVLHGD